ncbi:MAG: hypothetical protein ABSD57_04985 [Verrucomicrobiota bacterium]
MTLKTYIALTALALLLLPQLATAQGNLVVNGGFDTSANDWILTNGAYWPEYGNSGWAVALDKEPPSPSTEPTASQIITGLVPGYSYLVSGNYGEGKDRGGGSPSDPSFGVAIDGIFLFEAVAPDSDNWQSFSFYYTASSSSALLSLSSQINGTGVAYFIDNISMEAVPEPNSLCLIGVGGITVQHLN